MNKLDIATLDWDKMQDLLPAVIQHYRSGQVLMLGYVSRLSLEQTLQDNNVTFYSRSKDRLWTKGEESGNVLRLVDIIADCDRDSVLIFADPQGPTCHQGTTSCFGEASLPALAPLAQLADIIAQRQHASPNDSYTSQLLHGDIKRTAQKVGEEGVEVALAAATGDGEECQSESADLLYHLLVLLQQMQIPLSAVLGILQSRMK